MSRNDVTWKSAIEDILRAQALEFSGDVFRPWYEPLGRLFPFERNVVGKVSHTLAVVCERGSLDALDFGRYRKRLVLPTFSRRFGQRLDRKRTPRAAEAGELLRVWAQFNLHCLECPSDDISAISSDPALADLRCPSCGAIYLLAGIDDEFGDAAACASSAATRLAVADGSLPHLLLVAYDWRSSRVATVRAIPGPALGDTPFDRLRRATRLGNLPVVDVVESEPDWTRNSRDSWRAVRWNAGGSERVPAEMVTG